MTTKDPNIRRWEVISKPPGDGKMETKIAMAEEQAQTELDRKIHDHIDKEDLEDLGNGGFKKVNHGLTEE